MLTITLKDIRAHVDEEELLENEQNLARLLGNLDKSKNDAEPISLERILQINGLEGTLWMLPAVQGHDNALRLFACHCARYGLVLFENTHPNDKRPRKAIETAERFARGQATKDELGAAEEAALGAARDTQRNASDVASASVGTVSKDACLAVTHTCRKIALCVASAVAQAANEAVKQYDAGVAEDAAWNKGWHAAYDNFVNEFQRLCRLEGEYGEVDGQNVDEEESDSPSP
jgi:hypothetical protein